MVTRTLYHRISATWCLLSGLMLAAGTAASEFPEVVNTKIHSPTLISSGQPSEGQFDEIAGAGVDVVINLAPKNLPNSLQNEEKLAKSSGMNYHFIPVHWENPDQADFDRFLQVMDAAAGKTVLVHCWVNARSSAFVYLYRVLRAGKAQDAEYKVLEEIWDNNKGYELRNAPQWREFLDEAMARHRTE